MLDLGRRVFCGVVGRISPGARKIAARLEVNGGGHDIGGHAVDDVGHSRPLHWRLSGRALHAHVHFDGINDVGWELLGAGYATTRRRADTGDACDGRTSGFEVVGRRGRLSF